jgi:ATP-dependent DNA helicase PIF1
MRLRSQGKKVVVVASSGIAATLLEGGKTVHSRFGIPLNITPTSSSSITPRSEIGRMLSTVDAIYHLSGMNNP